MEELPLRALRRLKIASFQGCEGVGDALAHHLHHIEQVNVAHTGMGDRGLQVLAEVCACARVSTWGEV